MSGRLFGGTARENTAVRGRARTLLVLGGAIGLAGILGIVAQAATPPAYDATAKVTPGLYYVNDTRGSVYTFTVTNTGSSAGIGAVEIRRPSIAWAVSGCVPPVGWTSQRSTDKCRFVSAASTSDDLKPGKSMTFKVGAKTAPGNVNQVGTWPVVVSKSNHFATPSLLRYARATGSGLSTVQHVFELTTAVVSGTLKAPGTTCPPAAKEAIVGTTTNVIVCGRNRGNVALAPSKTYSSLSGTFLKSTGTFSSGTIQANSGDVVLARWSGAVVSDVFGSGKKVVTHVGSASNRTSPLRTFTGYFASSKPPVAVNDANSTDEDTPLTVAAPGVLANDTNAEAGETLTAVDATQPANGTVVVNPNGSYTYTPNAHFNGTDTFTYKTFDTYTKSGSATVTITVNPVNDAPVAGAVAASTPEDTPKAVILDGTDVDSPSLTYEIVSDPSHGTLGAIVGNAVTYTPDPDYHGADSFTYKASDGSAGSNVATVSLTVDAVNDAPVGVADAVSVDEDAATSAPAPGVLGNDTDVEGSALTATLVTGPAHASAFELNPDGSYSYAPAADYHGPDSFTYTASDGDLLSAVTTVAITVAPVNDAPVAAGVSVDAVEDTPKTIGLDGTDVDGDALTYSIVGGPSHGTLGAVDGDEVTYTPNPNYSGADSFTYKVSDGTLDSADAVVTIAVSAVNDVPVAGDDAYSTDEDTALNVAAPGVLANDTDVESPLTAVVASGPSHGTLTLNPDGSFTYTPAANYSGPDSFTYTASDGDASSPAATVTLTVNAVNDAPTATAASVATDEDTAKTITLSGTDVEGSPLTYAIVAGPTHGSLGAVSGDEVTYTPAANYSGPDSFTFKANDGTLDSADATVTITVNPVNDAPVSVNDAYVTNEDTALNVTAPGVLANDFDVDNDPLTAALVTGPSHGTLTLNPDGSFTYTPSANYNGADSFTYEISDGTLVSTVATVTLSVDAVNDAPVTQDGSATTTEDTAKAVTLSGADPVEAGPVTFSIVGGPAHGSLGAVSGNSVTYTPGADFNGTDTFTFKANDGDADSNVSTVTVTVTPVNDAPSFTKGADVTVVQDSGAHTAAGWATAISKGPADESGQTLTFAVSADDAALFSAQPAVDAATGDLTFTPAPGVTGETEVEVTLSDDGGTLDGGADTSAPQVFTIKVVPPNATPVADAKSAGGNEDGGAIPVTLSANDSDGDALTFTAGTAANGLVTVPAGTSCTAGACTATVTYTPNVDFFGTDSFTYTVNDGTIDSAAVTVTVTVNPVNDAPSFTKGADQFVNEDSGAHTVAGWATGKSVGPANESAQSVTYEVTGTTNDGLFSVLPSVDAAGDLTYTPAPNANGAATVSVRAVDDGGTANGGVDASPVQTFSISVLPVNDAPSFTKGADQAVNEDAGAQSVSGWAAAISKGPADESAQSVSFTTSNDNNALFSVQPGVTPTGTLVYTPAPDAVGSATVTITLSDSGGVANGGDDTSDGQTFTITVNPVNDAPSFSTAGNRTVLEDAGAQTVNGFVESASPGPADEAGQTVTVAVTNVTNPALFSAAPAIANGTLTYTPAANANGVSTVTVRATDDGGTANGGVDTSPTQTFTITVTAVNDAPSFTKGADQTVNEDSGAQSLSTWASAISTGPADESGQTVAFVATNDNNALFSSQPAISPAGTLTYTSAANRHGTATVTVTLSDNGGTANGGADTSAPQTFTITVNPVNDAPVAAAKGYTVQANMKVSLTGLLAGATDPNDVAGDPAWSPTFTVGSVTPGAGCVGCTVSNIDQANGTFDFDPPAGGTGTYTVNYTVVDSGHPAPGVASAPQTITFTVNGPVVWFVDTTAASGGTGRLSAPFNTLPPATTAMGSTANHRIFVRGGNVTGNVTLPTDGWLISEAATGASFDAVMGITPPVGTIARPAVNGTQRTLTGTVTVGTNSVVRGVDLTPAGSAPGLVGSGRTGLVVNQMSIQSTTGRAVDLASSSGVINLTRVSSNGASRGISLVNTNVSTGSFTVTGTGTAGSGGTIANSTATGATGFGNNDGGIYLNNTRNVSLDRMVVSGGQGSGIYGHNVTGFTLANSSITNNGTDVAKDHDGVRFDNALGAISISNTSVSGSKENNARFRNESGTSNITVTGSTFANNDPTIGANGLLLDTYNSAVTTFNGSGNTYTNNNTVGLALYSNSSGAYTATVNGINTFTGNYIGVDLGGNGTGPSTFVVDGVKVTGCSACGAPVNAYKGTGATSSPMLVTIKNADIDNQGSDLAPGIWVHGEGAGALRATITNNKVRGVEQLGIYGGIGNGGNATMDLNISNNDVDLSTAGPNSAYAIFVETGLLSGDANVTCADIKNNKAVTVPGIEGIAVQNWWSGAFRLPGFLGGTDTAAEAFIVANNTAPVTADAISQSGNGFSGGANCNTPA